MENNSLELFKIVEKLNGSLEWKTDKDLLTVNFFASGKKISDDKVDGMLLGSRLDISAGKLRSLILENARNSQLIEEHNDTGEIVFLNLPPRESVDDCDITEWDEKIWQDVKFVEGDLDTFYVKDSEHANTYTQYLNPASSDPKVVARTLKQAFNAHTKKPEHIVKALVKDINVNDKTFLSETMYTLPITAWNYIKIKATKRDKNIKWHNLIVPAGDTSKIYEGFVSVEGEFRCMPDHLIEKPKTLTNDPGEAAIAYIDLYGDLYYGHPSDLWDNFLLERFHNKDYVSIFKAWLWSVVVGKNNSRQEMWLYGNGGTGKSVMCKVIIDGINKLAHKDICLAASKDTGKSNFNSELLNKHLMVYSDAKNLKSGMSEAKHNITGGDFMRIEGKGKEATSAKVYMKCLTCSNELPKCDTTDRSQRSRYIILPFTLSDEEMQEKGLMDEHGNLLGSATFEDELKAEFNGFLASCREHYERRCPTNSNIDAHEANTYLESITLDEVEDAQSFVNKFFAITNNKKDRISVADFKQRYLQGVDFTNDDGTKPYANVKLSQIESYLEKLGFRKAPIHPNGDRSTSVKGWVHDSKGFTLRPIENN